VLTQPLSSFTEPWGMWQIGRKRFRYAGSSWSVRYNEWNGSPLSGALLHEQPGDPSSFFVFGLVVMVALCVMGLITFERVLESSNTKFMSKPHPAPHTSWSASCFARASRMRSRSARARIRNARTEAVDRWNSTEDSQVSIAHVVAQTPA